CIVGSYGQERSFIWRPYWPNGTSGKVVEVESLTVNPDDVYARSMNTWNWVVGTEAVDYPTPVKYQFIWREGEGSQDLNVLKPSGLSGTITMPLDINDRGDVLVKMSGSTSTYAILLAD